MRTIITSDDADAPGALVSGAGAGAGAGAGGPFGAGRTSPARESIAQATRRFDSAFTVEELARVVRSRRPSTGLATVYRAVSSMEASGYLERVGDRSGTALFARCDAGNRHHHHAVCTGCGALVVTACPIDEAVRTAADAGFTVTGHEVTLYGLCRECSTKPDGATRATAGGGA